MTVTAASAVSVTAICPVCGRGLVEARFGCQVLLERVQAGRVPGAPQRREGQCVVSDVVGLDLSLVATGVAAADGSTSTLRTRLVGMERLAWLADHIEFETADADLVVIEDVPHGARNNAAGPLSMLHGVVRLAWFRAGRSFVTVPPATLKKFATGKGNATKPDLRMELYKRAGLDLPDDNQVDAWWLRAAGLDYCGAPVVVLPESHRVALSKVEWPCEGRG